MEKPIKLVYPKNVAFGFESTWRLKNVELQDVIDSPDHDNDNYFDTGILLNNPKFMSEFEKISSFGEILDDPYNIEIPTKKLTNKTKLLSDFNKLSNLLNQIGFIESSRSINNNFEGGGHLHIDYSTIFGDLGYDTIGLDGWNDYPYGYQDGNDSIIPIFYNMLIANQSKYTKYNNNKSEINNLFALFTHNMFVYILNNPWIPWTFNAPNDNVNAHIFSNLSLLKKDINEIRENGLELCGELHIDMKSYAVTLRPEYGTFEYRFLSMPKNSMQLGFFIDLIRSIHKYCFDLTINGIELKPIYANTDKPIYDTVRLTKHSIEYTSDIAKDDNYLSLIDVTFDECIAGLRKMCNSFGFQYSKIEKMGFINNLIIRYAYHEAADNSIISERVLN